MPPTVGGVDVPGLERSCKRPDSIRFGPATPGVERLEVHLANGFEPHRHDTYGVGLTTAGVQTFRYRGTRHTCLPGELHFLHPDETHDGGPATDDGFGYRIVYLAPELLHRALDGGELPFVAEPVQPRTRVSRAIRSIFASIHDPMSDLARVELAVSVADTLRSLAGRAARRASIDHAAVERVREYLAAHPLERTPAIALESIAGLDRFTVARQFRRAFGTSPDRYRTMRRLEMARAAIEAGGPIARAAADAGFADQSHLTRQFKRAYGITPRRWASAATVG
jgi:AraC-like DNA-binding protein